MISKIFITDDDMKSVIYLRYENNLAINAKNKYVINLKKEL